MAADDIEYVTLRLSGKTFTTVEWVGEVLSNCEYSYNIALIVSKINDPDYSKISPAGLYAFFDDLENHSLWDQNSAFRSVIREEDLLRVERLVSGNSFTLQLAGFSKAIEALRVWIDPIDRARRREANRHQEEMNRAEEQAAADKNIMRRHTYVSKTLDDLESLFNRRASAELSESQRLELNERIQRERLRLLDKLGSSHVEIIESTIEPDDGPAGEGSS
ncbi:hypothetical protein [Arthrobacter sp. 9MFCol3.1]|uniref:hypothetical protein n=1 Tax=Arthrobacter sp. 9MFCol3.1 TaxID=1150398 RepID=UPI00047C1027|nr:hypothetical protein [Arthrobacter sp. 9MFCol3.1]